MGNSRQHLERHGNQWRVRRKVPKELQSHFGKAFIKVPLGTDSLAVANRDKWKHLARIEADFEAARKQARVSAGKAADKLTDEAMTWRDAVEDARRDPTFYQVLDDTEEVVEDGYTLTQELLHDRVEEVERRHGPIKAKVFFDVATDRATPIEPLIERWLAEKVIRPRQIIDYRRALRKLVAWLDTEKLATTLESVTRKVAGRYVSEAFVATGTHWKTANKDISCLSSFWRWSTGKGLADDNVWREQSLPKREPEDGEGKRPFTDHEIAVLLDGDCPGWLHHMMVTAALTGMRIEEIARLTCDDVRDGMIEIRVAKTKAGRRCIPVHNDLRPIFERRTKDKKDGSPLFPELPTPAKGSANERSQKAVKAFTRYRRGRGVDDVPEGARQSRVDFHSFRRWFITKAEQADQAPHIIAALVGHKRPGETLGRYSGGPLKAQFERVIEAVRLPTEVKIASSASDTEALVQGPET